MNKKGQALVEFILILPVFLMILMSLIDVGNIFLNKYELNKDLEIICELYQNGDKEKMISYVTKENLDFSEKEIDGMNEITIKKTLKINAIGLSNILGKNYIIETSKSIYGDKNES